MSQRLCIGDTDKDYYDLVIYDIPKDAISLQIIKSKLISDWLIYTNGIFFGSLKVAINDKQLFKTISPIIEQVITDVGLKYPNDLVFYINGKVIDSPTKSQLNKSLLERKQGDGNSTQFIKSKTQIVT